MTNILVTAAFASAHNKLLDAGREEERHFLLSTLTTAFDEVEKRQPGADRARWVNNRIDQDVERNFTNNPGSQQVSCKKGCSSCCRILVHVTSDEADLLAEKVAAEGIPVDIETLRRQATYGGEEDWVNRPNAETSCIFLSNLGTCKIYNDRPSACRKYFVVSPAIDCDKEGNFAGSVLVWSVPEAEAVACATLNLSTETDSLPKMLLKRLMPANT